MNRYSNILARDIPVLFCMRNHDMTSLTDIDIMAYCLSCDVMLYHCFGAAAPYICHTLTNGLAREPVYLQPVYNVYKCILYLLLPERLNIFRISIRVVAHFAQQQLNKRAMNIVNKKYIAMLNM